MTLVVRALLKVLSSPEFITLLFDVVIANNGFNVPVAALVKSKKRKLFTTQAEIENRSQQFIEVEAIMHPRIV